MPVNASTRPIRLLIGGMDFSPCFVSYDGARSKADQSGLLTLSGSIELRDIRGVSPESLDDRSNPSRWRRGQTVTLDIYDSAGTWQRFPHGALRILSAEFERGRLVLDVGCLIALTNFRSPTDSDRTGINPPSGSLAQNIINNLLAEMALPALSDPLNTLSINYPINLGNSYWSAIGELAFSANSCIWIDQNENIRCTPLNVAPGSPDLAIAIGSDEIDYRRITGAQSPAEIVRVVGTRKSVEDAQLASVRVGEEYGPAYAAGVDSPGTILLARETITDTWSPSGRTRTITTEREAPIGTFYPDYGGSLTQLWTVLEEEKIYTYEADDGEDGGKLRTIETSATAPAQIALGSYQEFLNSDPGIVTNPLESKGYYSETETYQYSSKAETKRITRDRRDTIATILPDEDWSAYGVSAIPGLLKTSKYEEREWEEIRKNQEWEEKVTSRTQSSTVPADSTLDIKIALSNVSVERQISNQGIRPPAPDRRPADFTVEERPFEYEQPFPQYGGNPFKEREITIQVPYLGSNPAAQASAIAQSQGAILIGRHKGSQIQVGFRDELLTLEPLDCLDITEAQWDDGSIVTRAFLVDGEAFAVTPEEIIASYALIWVGDRSGATVGGSEVLIPPYEIVFSGSIGTSAGTDGEAFQYSVEGSEFSGSAGIAVGWAGGFEATDPGGGEEDVGLPGAIVCADSVVCGECEVGGKAFQSYGPYSGPIHVVIGFGMPTLTEDEPKAIEVHRWSQEPNSDLIGREWVADLPEVGGSTTITFDETYQWVSFFVKNPIAFDDYDAACFQQDGITFTLVGFE